MSHDVLESSDAILIPKPLKTTCFEACREVVPNLFGIRDWFHGRQFFSRTGEGGDGFCFSHLLPCGPVPNRPWTGCHPWPRGLGTPALVTSLVPGVLQWWDNISWSESMSSHLSGYSVIPFNLQVAFFSSDNCLRVTALLVPSSTLVAF